MEPDADTAVAAEQPTPDSPALGSGADSGGAGAGAGSWSVGFHGAVAPRQQAELVGVSVRDLALSRRSMGAGRLAHLTVLPASEPATARTRPTSDRGANHVGINHVDVATHRGPALTATGPAPTPSRPEPTSAAPQPESAGVAVESGSSAAVAPAWVLNPNEPAPPAAPPHEPLTYDNVEAWVARRLEDAEFLFLPNRGRGYATAKRSLDLIGSLLLLAVSWPIILLLAIMIRLDSPGPAIFRQQRVTRGGRPFTFYKFRTMYVDAKERFPELYAYHYADTEFDGAYYKLADDPRNTRVGRWLRRTTLDELPNLFNVVLGDLSLVGPRPELPELVEHYRPEELACFFTKAGLTGLAQVAGRSLLTVRERLTLDLRYVAHQTLLLDLRILWRTVVVVLTGKGAF